MIASPILTRLPAVAAPIEKTIKKRSQKIKQAKEITNVQIVEGVERHTRQDFLRLERLRLLERVLNHGSRQLRKLRGQTHF